jgi:hypothetical protein
MRVVHKASLREFFRLKNTNLKKIAKHERKFCNIAAFSG